MSKKNPGDPRVKKNAFVHKLYTMLHDPALSHLIWWTNRNGEQNTFALCPGKEFADCLTQYFKHGNVASFVRQLHMYGFHKVSDPLPITYPPNGNNNNNNNKEVPPVWEFKHLSGRFKRGDETSLVYIKRRSSSNHTSGSTIYAEPIYNPLLTNPYNQPQFMYQDYSMGPPVEVQQFYNYQNQPLMYYQQPPGQVPPPPPPSLPPHQQPEMALQYHQYNNYQQPPPAPPAPPQPGNVLFGYQQVAPPQQPGSTVQQIPANAPPTLDQTQPLLYTPQLEYQQQQYSQPPPPPPSQLQLQLQTSPGIPKVNDNLSRPSPNEQHLQFRKIWPDENNEANSKPRNPSLMFDPLLRVNSEGSPKTQPNHSVSLLNNEVRLESSTSSSSTTVTSTALPPPSAIDRSVSLVGGSPFDLSSRMNNQQLFNRTPSISTPPTQNGRLPKISSPLIPSNTESQSPTMVTGTDNDASITSRGSTSIISVSKKPSVFSNSLQERLRPSMFEYHPIGNNLSKDVLTIPKISTNSNSGSRTTSQSSMSSASALSSKKSSLSSISSTHGNLSILNSTNYRSTSVGGSGSGPFSTSTSTSTSTTSPTLSSLLHHPQHEPQNSTIANGTSIRSLISSSQSISSPPLTTTTTTTTTTDQRQLSNSPISRQQQQQPNNNTNKKVSVTSLLLPSHSQSQGYAQPLYKSSVIAEEENSTTSSGGGYRSKSDDDTDNMNK